MIKSETEDQNNKEEDTSISSGGIVIGMVVGLDEQGRPLVEYKGNRQNGPVAALATVSVTRNHISRQVALLFNGGDTRQPVIVGFIYKPLDELLENFELVPVREHDEDSPFPESHVKVQAGAAVTHKDDNLVTVDGKHVCIEGAEEVTFKCGKASITLTKSGKILIRGTYLLNRSSGVNRIMGGSVQVN
jgi:hypothetical protein